MSLDPSAENSPEIRGKSDLVEWFERAGKPRSDWRVGLEHEKIAVTADLAALPYEGPGGIRDLLQRSARFGYRPFLDAGVPIAAESEGLWLSLEPGGQLELSGRPHRSALDAAREHLEHVGHLEALGRELGFSLLGIGFRPFGDPDQMPWMPKRRYAVMRDYLPARGSLALQMMQMTAGVQASFDFRDEADCAAKVTAAASVCSLLTALFANSPVTAGKPNGHQSWRCRIWRDVDRVRCGLQPWHFDFSFERYVDWILNVPMIFIRRDGEYLPAEGRTFSTFLRDGVKGTRATLSDFTDHLSTLFPAVRVKRVIELRSTDACDLATSNALPALGKGVLYDAGARDAATELTDGLSLEDRLELQRRVAVDGLRARVPGRERSVRELCGALLAVANEGLRRQGCVDESALLEPLEEIVASGRSPADRLLQALEEHGPAGLVEASRIRREE